MHIGEKVIARGVSWFGDDFSLSAIITNVHEDHNGKQVLFETNESPKQGTWVKQRKDGSWKTVDYNSPFFVELVPIPLSVMLITQFAEE